MGKVCTKHILSVVVGGGGEGQVQGEAATTPAPILPLSLSQRISLKGSTY